MTHDVAHELQVQIWRNVRRAFEIRQAENGLTQSGIAARMGLHRARVNYWMTRPERMTLAAAARLLAAMDARLDCQILMATAGSGGDDTARAD